jgi:hypothetical protein
MNNDVLKQAEVAAYFKKFDEAEKLYLDIDRRLILNFIVISKIQNVNCFTEI